jgi:hypothetical protein
MRRTSALSGGSRSLGLLTHVSAGGGGGFCIVLAKRKDGRSQRVVQLAFPSGTEVADRDVLDVCFVG